MILDQYGKALTSAIEPANVRSRILGLMRENRTLRARFDAAQTIPENEGHWSNADRFDPHTTASLAVRQKLRSRSRYEIIENNPYLKGTILTICNDFVGTGPKLKITDKRLTPATKKAIELRFNDYWVKKIKLRQKLWRMRLAKIVDGETFARMYLDTKLDDPVQLNLKIYEGDQITSGDVLLGEQRYNEVDGVRFNDFEDVISYHILRYHPGGSMLARLLAVSEFGEWVPAQRVIHWFRKDRGWLRGIPETTASLPLCAILRRYTLAVLRHAEVAADITGFFETEGPPNVTPWTTDSVDDPFDTFPIDRGLIMNLPWGYKFKQADPVPNGADFDAFVGAMLREITRPLLTPYNLTIGSSHNANMASAVVDTHIYKEGQSFERLHCEEEVLEPTFAMWYRIGYLTEDYFDNPLTRNNLLENPSLRDQIPLHKWMWPRIGLEHTDPEKVANALIAMNEAGHLTDRDIQEQYFNRDIETWREEVMEDDAFMETLPSVKKDREAEQKPAANDSNAKKPATRSNRKKARPSSGQRKSRSARKLVRSK